MIATLLRGFEIRSTFSINLFWCLFIFFRIYLSLVVGSRRESRTSRKIRVSWLSSDYRNRRCEFRFPQALFLKKNNTAWNYADPYYQTESTAVKRDHAEFMIDQLVDAHVKMVDDFFRKLDATYIQLNNIIGRLSECLENLELRVDRISATIKKREQYRTRGEKSIRSFVGCWFEMF